MSTKDKILISFAVNGLKYGLKSLKPFLLKHDFDSIVDKVLNGAESYFQQGSWRDIATEAITAEVREYLEVKDSDPEN